jgi:hypothetical protein
MLAVRIPRDLRIRLDAVPRPWRDRDLGKQLGHTAELLPAASTPEPCSDISMLRSFRLAALSSNSLAIPFLDRTILAG